MEWVEWKEEEEEEERRRGGIEQRVSDWEGEIGTGTGTEIGDGKERRGKWKQESSGSVSVFLSSPLSRCPCLLL